MNAPRSSRSAVLVMLSAAIALTLIGTVGPTGPRVFAATDGWTQVAAADPSSDFSGLTGVSCDSTSDCWAVGSTAQYVSPTSNTSVEYIVHWNGTTWTSSSAPGAGPLSGVVALASNNVWAVGTDPSTGNILIEHWNGTAWSTAGPAVQGSLVGIAAVSASDIWAVGHAYVSGIDIPLAFQFNGTSWASMSPLPQGTDATDLNAVTALPATSDIMAVGSYSDALGTHSFAETYHAGTWTVTLPPDPYPSDELEGVTAVSSTDVTAVGRYNTGSIAFTWNGTAWSTEAIPSTPWYWLSGVASSGAADVVAVGEENSNNADPTSVVTYNGASWSYANGAEGCTAGRANANTCNNQLVSDSFMSNGTIMAVGTYGDTYNTEAAPLAELWNGSTWTLQTLPTPSATVPDMANLNGVYAASGTSAMAVGTATTPTRNITLAELWNGGSWSLTPTPNQGVSYNGLAAVSGSSPSSMWAVGSYGDSTNNWDPNILAEFWNGSSWTINSPAAIAPATSGCGSMLNGVWDGGSSNVWAVGLLGGCANLTALTEHWNGSSWTAVTPQDPGTQQDILNAVSGTGASDVWAAGYQETSGVSTTLMEHWDGTSWSVVTTPNLAGNDVLTAISAYSATDAVAVGYVTSGSMQMPLAMAWNGTSWSLESVPVPACGGGSSLGGVVAYSNSAHAVGSYPLGGFAPEAVSGVWNGGDVVDPGQASNVLNALSGISEADVWAVGTQETYAQVSTPLIEHFAGGSPPTAAQAVCSGTLSLLSSNAVTFPAVTETGFNMTTSATQTIVVGDNTGSGNGWSITLSSTPFVTGSGTTLADSDFTVTATPTSSCSGSGSCTVASFANLYPFVLPGGTAAKLASDSTNAGLGDVQVNCQWNAAIPANSYAGAYSSTWTLTLASGP